MYVLIQTSNDVTDRDLVIGPFDSYGEALNYTLRIPIGSYQVIRINPPNESN